MCTFAVCAAQKHDPGATHNNDHFWHVVVRGPEVLLNWGKVRSRASRACTGVRGVGTSAMHRIVKQSRMHQCMHY